MNATALGVIPARYGSTRFPGKPLAMLAGKPLIQHVYERATRSVSLERVIVATDDARIQEAIARCGGEAVMTPSDLASGTDRVAAVARELPYGVVVNIQGDEPLVEPAMIDQIAHALRRDPQLEMATLCCPLTAADVGNPHVVKVTRDHEAFAQSFSRTPSAASPETLWKHLGMYAYRKDTLLRLVALAPSPSEQAEHLEQLRALDHGIRIKVIETAHDTVAVDTPDDLTRVEQQLARAHG